VPHGHATLGWRVRIDSCPAGGCALAINECAHSITAKGKLSMLRILAKPVKCRVTMEIIVPVMSPPVQSTA